MTAPSWFASQTPVRHTIHYPGALELAAAKRKSGTPQTEVEEFLHEHSFWVEVRELTAGDRATLEEMRFTESGEGKLDFGAARLLTVKLCLVTWSLPEPATEENINQLKPLVLDAILAVIDEGRLMAPGEGDAANGSGHLPDQQLVALAADAKDAPPDG